MSSNGGESVPLRRRNGHKPSCEPCRKAKYACDHNMPICERCKLRGVPQSCTYHPSPMKGLTRSKARQRTICVAQSDQYTPSVQSAKPIAEIRAEEPRVAEDTIFFGPTAFNAVLLENDALIAAGSEPKLQAIMTDAVHGWRLDSLQALRRPGPQNNDAKYVMEVLKDLPHLVKILSNSKTNTRFFPLLGPWLHNCESSIVKDLWDQGIFQSDAAMESAIRMLDENTKRPMNMPSNIRFRDFSSFFTGANLRWEALGMFLTACGLCLFGLGAHNEALAHYGHSEKDKQQLQHRLNEASLACVSLTEETGRMTDVGFMLMIRTFITNSQICGDADHRVLRQWGNLATAMFNNGYHTAAYLSGVPFWLQELRRRAVGEVFALDKAHSAFTGHPPRLSSQYCHIEIPTDINYSDLALEGEELDNALKLIGPDGWNRTSKRKNFVALSFRSFVSEAVLREEVLQMCLSTGPAPSDLQDRASNLIQRLKDLYLSLPITSKPSSDRWPTVEAEPTFTSSSRYLSFSFNCFMILRHLNRTLRTDPTDLVLIAHQMLVAVIEACNIRRTRETSMSSLCWIVVLYGLPSAGMLAIELLQCNVQALSHGKVRQDLAVFLNHLKCLIVPGDGNYQHTEKARRTLQHILDSPVVNNLQSSGAGNLQRDQDELITAAGNGMDGMGISDEFGTLDFSWLEAAHFEQDFWYDPSST